MNDRRMKVWYAKPMKYVVGCKPMDARPIDDGSRETNIIINESLVEDQRIGGPMTEESWESNDSILFNIIILIVYWIEKPKAFIGLMRKNNNK